MNRDVDRLVVGGLLIALLAQTGAAQEVGDTVEARRIVELKVEDRVVATVAVGEELTVRQLSDKWLWVQTADGQRGWVLKDAVRLPRAATEPSATFPEAATPRSEAEPPNNPFLPAIGVLAGQNIYTTYAYIGAIADGYDSMAYKSEEVQQLMSEVSSMSKVVVDNLRQVQEMNLGADDRQAIDNVIDVLSDLGREADALATYAKTDLAEDLKAYDDARTTVWPKVREILQLE